MNEQESLWKQYLSIDEKKASTLLICLIVCLLFAGVNYVRFGDITANLATIITALIYAIAGVNVSNMVGNMVNRGFSSPVNQTGFSNPQTMGMNNQLGMNNQQGMGLNNSIPKINNN